MIYVTNQDLSSHSSNEQSTRNAITKRTTNGGH